jgi:hypothetical protein
LPSRALPLVAIAATVAIFTPFARRGINPHHDGIMLKPALDVLAGKTLFRDTFSQYGIGITYMQAAALWLLTPTLAALRLATVGVYALGAAFLVDAWRRLLPSGLALLAFAVWLVLAPFYGFGTVSGQLELLPLVLPWCSVWAILFQAIALDALVCALLGGRPVPTGLVAGVSCGMVFLCRQPVGVITSIAVLCGLGLGAWRTEAASPRRVALLACAAGLGVVVGLAGLFVLASGTFGAWYVQTVELPRRWAIYDRSRADVLQHVLKCLVGRPDLTLPWIALGAAAVFSTRLLKQRPTGRQVAALVTVITAAGVAYLVPVGLRLAAVSARSTVTPAMLLGLSGAFTAWATAIPALLLGLGSVLAWRTLRGRATAVDLAALGGVGVGLASWLQYFPVPCPNHKFWSVTPAVGLAVYAVWCASGRRTTATALIIVVMMLPLALVRMLEARTELGLPYVRLHGGVLDGMWVAEKEAADWQRLVALVDDQVRKRPDVPMLVAGYAGLYAALVESRSNPGPFFADWIPGVELTADRVRFIEATRPLVFVEHQAPPEIAEAMSALGYAEVFRGPNGRLLVPGGQPTGH